MSAPIMKSRKLGSESMPGRECVPVQIPHTTNAPRVAPLLLAEPPTISMAQITKVASSGSKVSLLHGLPPNPLSRRGFPAWRCGGLANSAAAVQCGAVGLDDAEGCRALLGVAAHAVDPTLKAGAISERTIGGTENPRARRRLLCGDRASPVLHEELTVQALMDLQLRSGVARPLLTR